MLARYASGEAVKDAVRNREVVGNRGKLVGSGRTKSFVSGSWSGCPRGLVMDKRSHWKTEQDRELYGGQDCLGQVRGVNTRCAEERASWRNL